MINLWVAEWHSKTKWEGGHRHIIYDNLLPALFKTRRECRAYIKERYGYIADRPDLRAEPHGWRIPQAKKAKVILYKEVSHDINTR